MHLIYIDESGNTGNNFADIHQPIFVLCAMIVPEHSWVQLEQSLEAVVDRYFPSPRPPGFEIHATELRTARDPLFRALSVSQRIALRDEMMEVAVRHDVKLIANSVDKKRYQKWLLTTFGAGVVISPHVAAFALVARTVNDYLKSLAGSPRGIFISDRNDEVVADVEKSIKVLRGTTGAMKLDQIIEKGFFIDSSKSLPLQLCDLFAMSFRKLLERKNGGRVNSIDDTGIAFVEKLRHRSPHDIYSDVLGWLTEQQTEGAKRSGQGHKS